MDLMEKTRFARELLVTTPPRSRPLADRFWEKVDRRGPDECWPWTGSRDPLGYGYIALAGHIAMGAHRMAYTIVVGDPGPLYVLHRCDNPPCCNPAHLSLGTHADNLREAVERGLFHVKVSDETVVALRKRVAAGESVWSVARELHVKYSTAKKIVKGVLRPHVGGPLTRPRRRLAGMPR